MDSQFKLKMSVLLGFIAVVIISTNVVDTKLMAIVTVFSGFAVGYHIALNKQYTKSN